MFGDPSVYKKHTLSKRNLEEYFRDGGTIVRGVLPIDLVSKLREIITEDVGNATMPWDYMSWMDSDELMDFYLHSNLGDLAAQLFRQPGTQTFDDKPGPIYLWSDFFRFRKSDESLTSWHIDKQECAGDVPANYTKRAFMRAWITLDDDVPGVEFVNQTLWAENQHPSAESNQKYWNGEHILPFENSGLKFNHSMAESILIRPTGLRKGDVILHSSCVMHRSPTNKDGRTLGFLCPTLVPETTKVFEPPEIRWTRALRACNHNLSVGTEISVGHPCYQKVHPHQPAPGTQFDVRHDATAAHWAQMWFDWHFGGALHCKPKPKPSSTEL